MRVLIACDFELWLNQAEAQTKSGRNLLDTYKALLLSEPLNCKMVNRFLDEATKYLFDAGVHQVYENVEDYIRSNKIGWRLACIIAHIEGGSNHLLEAYALRKLQDLSMLEENDLILKIQSGALKEIQYASGVRDLMAACNIDNPSVEYQSNYAVEVPHCCCESVGGSTYYFLENRLYKQTGKQIEVSQDWSQVSESFKVVSWLLNQPICERRGDSFHISYGGKTYIVSEALCRVVDNGIKTYDVEQLRESNRIQQMASPNREREYVMEAVAKLMESNNIYEMDHIKVYSTDNHRFTLLEGDTLLYTDPYNVVDKPAHEILEGIYKATGIALNETYKPYIMDSINEESIDDIIGKQDIKEHEEKLELTRRIEQLTEKFQNDPTKLAVLASLSKSIHA